MEKDRRDFLKIMTSTTLAASLLPVYLSAGEQEPKAEAENVSPGSKAEAALAMMQRYGSCCTGVLAAYAAECGLAEDLAAGLGRGMAGGIGGLGHVCGAVSGAALVIGLKTTNQDNILDRADGFTTMARVSEFIDRFRARHATILCRELIGCEIRTPEQSMAAMKANVFANCPGYVESAVAILEEMFRPEKT
ncbi:MAG: C_GCAxxG_C_C family protein [Acidobacteria bacterium]|nr:C_GCAxxG_C_C family protein [Acidobacteriota bacterium]